MSTKKKGTTISLAEFAGDAYENTLLPSESKGVERLDSGRPPRSDGQWGRGDRGDRGDRPERSERSFGGDRADRGDRAPRREGDAEGSWSREGGPREGGRPEDSSKADETSDWRSEARQQAPMRSADSSFGRGSSFRSRETSDEPDNWRGAPRREITPTTSFGRSGESSGDRRSADASPGNWRDQLSGPRAAATSAAPAAASGGTYVPLSKRGLAPVPEKPAAPAPAATAAPVPAKAAKAPVSWDEEEEEVIVDEEKLRGFGERFAALLRDETKKFETFAKKAAENFTAAELQTNIPLNKAAETVVEYAAEVSDVEAVLGAVRRCGVLFHQIQAATKDNKFELKVLVAFQKAVSKRNFPRISPQCALIEALWLALYEAQVVAEEAARLWTESPAGSIDYMLQKGENEGDFGRSTVLFQTQALRQWLLAEEDQTAKAPKAAGGWGSDEEEEDVDADLQSYLSQTISRSKGAVSIKKSISASAARR